MNSPPTHTITIKPGNYAITLEYLVDLAGEFYGKVLAGEIDLDTMDLGFEQGEGETSLHAAKARATTFLASLNQCFSLPIQS